MSLREMLSDYWYAFQQELFPRLESELGPMGERHELFVAVLELVRVEAHVCPTFAASLYGVPDVGTECRISSDELQAKAIFKVQTKRDLIERQLRSIRAAR